MSSKTPGRRRGVVRTVSFSCGWCGKCVERSLHAAGRARFCSRACAAAKGRASRVSVARVSVSCLGCGRMFEKWRKDAARAQQHFHDLDCRRHYRAVQAAERAAIPSRLRPPGARARVTRECAICSANFNVPPSQAAGARYCSLACKDVAQSQVMTGRRKVATWASTSFRGMVRCQMVDRCAICGWSEGRNDVCHITARKDGGADSIDNVVMLCPNHHRLFDAGKISREEVIAARHRSTAPTSASS